MNGLASHSVKPCSCQASTMKTVKEVKKSDM